MNRKILYPRESSYMFIVAFFAYCTAMFFSLASQTWVLKLLLFIGGSFVAVWLFYYRNRIIIDSDFIEMSEVPRNLGYWLWVSRIKIDRNRMEIIDDPKAKNCAVREKDSLKQVILPYDVYSESVIREFIKSV